MVQRHAPPCQRHVKDIPVETWGGESRCWRICLLEGWGPKPALSVHTGGIDCTWKKIKDKLPPGINTRKKGKINKAQQSTARTACCERLPSNWKSKRRCEGKKWSGRTKGSKTVVKRDFFKKNVSDFGYFFEPPQKKSLTGAKDCDFQCWKLRPVNSPRGCLWYNGT